MRRVSAGSRVQARKAGVWRQRIGVLRYYAERVAVITGAGSGIGRALAVRLAAARARLALIDKDAAAVSRVATECRIAGAQSRVYVIDVTDREALIGSAAAVQAAFGRVDMVFAAAGVIHTGSLLSSEWADLDRVINVNLFGVLGTAKAFLPHMIASGGGRLVIFSSGFGLMAAPRYSAYCASKSAVSALAQSLRLEMALAGHPISVSCVYPGAIRTPIVSRGTFAADVNQASVTDGFRRLARMNADRAAEIILRQTTRREGQVLVGADARMAAWAVWAAGSSYPRLMSWVLRRRRRLSSL